MKRRSFITVRYPVTDRRVFIGMLGGGVLIVPLALLAQTTTKVWRIGYLRRTSREPADIAALRQGLRELGYVEGQNLVIDERYADGDAGRLPGLARELVQRKVEALVVDGGVTVRAVVVPVLRAGILNNPTANAVPPTAGRLAELERLTAAARSLSIDLIWVDASSPGELPAAFAKLNKAGVKALLVTTDAMFFSQRALIVDLTAKHRLPAVYGEREFADAGGLLAYAPNNPATFRRAATFVDKILKGANPGDLPIEQPTRLELVINLRAAKALGITIPQLLSLRADEVIQ